MVSGAQSEFLNQLLSPPTQCSDMRSGRLVQSEISGVSTEILELSVTNFGCFRIDTDINNWMLTIRRRHSRIPTIAIPIVSAIQHFTHLKKSSMLSI